MAFGIVLFFRAGDQFARNRQAARRATFDEWQPHTRAWRRQRGAIEPRGEMREKRLLLRGRELVGGGFDFGERAQGQNIASSAPAGQGRALG